MAERKPARRRGDFVGAPVEWTAGDKTRIGIVMRLGRSDPDLPRPDLAYVGPAERRAAVPARRVARGRPMGWRVPVPVPLTELRGVL
jgi:hypothetical protein